MRKSNNNQHQFVTTTTIVMWTLSVAVVYCHQDPKDQFVANILPMDIIVATTTERSVELHIDNVSKEKEEIVASLNATEVTEAIADRQLLSNFTAFQEDIVPKRYTENIIAFYDSRRTSRHSEDVPAILLVAISAIAIILAFSIVLVSALYRRRRRLFASSKTKYHPKGSFFAVETESRAWDSLSFNNSIADLSTSKLQFHSLESLSDDSYINSLDEAISYKASIMHKKSLKNNASPKSTNNTVVSQLSISDQ